MDKYQQNSFDALTEAVEKLKNAGITEETLADFYRVCSSASNLGPEFLYWADVLQAIRQGLR